jgi:alkylation response protein AidB-like acyl-CoA dehydrogenase
VDVPKHEGLTYFVADMQAPGIETRPLRQITGEAEFDEVYLTEVVIPDTYRIGEVGSGWHVTMTTLAHERAAGAAVPPRHEGAVGQLASLWERHGDQAPQLADRAIDMLARSEVLRITADAAKRGGGARGPGAAWSFLKLARTELEQEAADLNLTLMGPDGLTYDDYSAPASGSLSEVIAASDPRRAFLACRALTLGGGTSEIQRTIIADRILGLPREHQADRGMAWSQIPRN